MELKILADQQMTEQIRKMRVEIPLDYTTGYTHFGIDPGVTNLGITFIQPMNKNATLFQIQLKRADNMIDRMVNIRYALQDCIGYFGFNPRCVIEGASFGNQYRQVELAEARAAIGLWFHNHSVKVDVIPPLMIRKSIFGSGKIKNIWENIPDDTAASLACVLYSMKEG